MDQLGLLPSPVFLQATLSLLLDHLSLVASFNSFNRMTHQNLAVCFGPVLLTPTQEAWRGGVGGGRGGRGGGKGLGHSEEIASAVDFKRHIEALHYLLQQWPGKIGDIKSSAHFEPLLLPTTNYISFHRCTSAHFASYPLLQCRHIESRQTITSAPPLLPPLFLPIIPWALSSSGIPLFDWLCLQALRRRWWCHVEIEVVWPGWRVHRQSTGTPETGASVVETSCPDRRRTMTRWQEVRAMEVNRGAAILMFILTSPL